MNPLIRRNTLRLINTPWNKRCSKTLKRTLNQRFLGFLGVKNAYAILFFVLYLFFVHKWLKYFIKNDIYAIQFYLNLVLTLMTYMAFFKLSTTR